MSKGAAIVVVFLTAALAGMGWWYWYNPKAIFTAIADLPGGTGALTPLALTRSGVRVVGQSCVGGICRAFGWTRPGFMAARFWGGTSFFFGGGTIRLQPYSEPDGTVETESDAYGIAADEAEIVVVGDAKTNLVWSQIEWTKSGPKLIPGPGAGWTGRAAALAVAADGNIVAGFGDSHMLVNQTSGSRSIENAGTWSTEALPAPPTSSYSLAYDVSDDGKLLCGIVDVGSGTPCVWTSATPGGPLTLELLPDAAGAAIATSGDGSVVAGSLWTGGVYWTRTNTGWSSHPLTPSPGYTRCDPYKVSEDGTVICGYMTPVDETKAYEGFIWSSGWSLGTGMMSADTVLANHGALAFGWFITEVTDVTYNAAANRIVMIGTGTNHLGEPRGWYARFEPHKTSIRIPQNRPVQDFRIRPADRWRSVVGRSTKN